VSTNWESGGGGHTPPKDDHIFVQATIPGAGDSVAVGDLWSDTTAAALKRCTSTSPITFVSVEGGSAAHALFSATHAADLDNADVPTDNQVLTYDSVAAKWSAEPASGHGDHVTFGGAGYPLDVEPTEADGTATTLPRSDHQHKLGIMTTRGDLIRRSATAAERLALGANGQHLASDGTDAVWEDDEVVINFIIDGGGSAITTGQKGHLEIPFAITITGWTILADVSGSIVVDVWKDTYALFPPTVADTIAGTEKPTLASVQKNQDLALGTWTTAVAAGDILAFNVDSATTVTRVVVALRGKKA
jgi:hypothetical protein